MPLVSRFFLLTNRFKSGGFAIPVSRLSLHRSTNFKLLTRITSKPVFYPLTCLQSSASDKQPIETTVSKPNQVARLKQAVRDYGSTIIVFHVVISLTSLGICYLAVRNGVDAVALLQRIGFSEVIVTSQVAVGGSTFVMSYAVHKLFAPIRIGITLSAAPFIVRYLRRINLLKPPKMKT